LFDAPTASSMEGTVILQDLSRRTVKHALTRRGDYRSSDIPDGHYYLHAQDYGLNAPQDYGQFTVDSPPAEIIVSVNSAYELSFTLERAGKISGRLTDPDGR